MRNNQWYPIRQHDKTMYRKSSKLFDEIQNEMIFRKHKVVIHAKQDLLRNQIIRPITRTPHDFRPMSRISADIKWMPLSNQGFNYILFGTCEI